LWYHRGHLRGPQQRLGTPFPFEGPVSPELLIDRRIELSRLARRAGDCVNVGLVAPRRFGRTSLLLAHAASWSRPAGEARTSTSPASPTSPT
jgi:hypothetical protein